MKLADKVRYLREVEGSLRGLNRAMTQQELRRGHRGRNRQRDLSVLSFADRVGRSPSPHQHDAAAAGAFFQGPSRDISSTTLRAITPSCSLTRAPSKTSSISGSLAARSASAAIPSYARPLLTLARHAESRNCLLLLESILETPPSLAERLLATACAPRSTRKGVNCRRPAAPATITLKQSAPQAAVQIARQENSK